MCVNQLLVKLASAFSACHLPPKGLGSAGILEVVAVLEDILQDARCSELLLHLQEEAFAKVCSAVSPQAVPH